MITLLVLLGLLGAATIGGVFFAFSTFVIGALAQLPPAHGVAAMQRINVVVLNPVFLGVFVGTAVVEGLIALLAVFGWDPARSPLLLAGAALYVVGCFGVTMAANVPRNERLRVLPAESAAALRVLADLRARVDAVEPRPHGGGAGRGGLRDGRPDGLVTPPGGRPGIRSPSMCDFGEHDPHGRSAFGYLVDTPEIRALIDETRRLSAAIADIAARVEALQAGVRDAAGRRRLAARRVRRRRT